MEKRTYEVDRAMSYADVGRIMGISRQRVQQIENVALKKLSSPELRDKWNDILETMVMMKKPMHYHNSGAFLKGSSTGHLSESETQLKD